ncbi:MAG TPA: NADH-quinone oxidoreductase subunit I [Syntrophomonadaceae bacterium]|nr:NADH-quinone oxidoreductase subunit I [Syntrophomonadaceae bacterium]
MFGKGLVKGLWTTLKHTFEWDITVQYPEEMPHLQPRFRGNLLYEIEKCIACGICVRSCPNNVLILEETRDAETKKKQVVTFTIDYQYCMYCNLCVETCPTNCLYFDHNFELAQFDREAIKTVYESPVGIKIKLDALDAEKKGETLSPEAEKEQKQITNMTNAVKKNPVKVLSRFVDDEAQAEILAEILLNDERKLERLVPLMIKDKEKAQKIAKAYVAKEIKQKDAPEKGGSE